MDNPYSPLPKRGGRAFPSWDEIYKNSPNESLGWFTPELDPDLEETLRERRISRGTFLDIGTGTGNQAIELARRGFSVTATDIAGTALEKAKALAQTDAAGMSVRWVVDDIVRTGLQGPFDYAFDRGCFHGLSRADRSIYVKNLERLLSHEGTLFLKCFSSEELFTHGTKRFSPREIEHTFGPLFKVKSVRPTVLQGSRGYEPKALFVELKPHS